MKMALPRLSKDSIVGWLLAHGEKIVVGMVLMVALALVWTGISSMQKASVAEKLRPDAIIAGAEKALEHIDKEPNPPRDKLAETSSLVKTLEDWKTPGEGNLRRPIFSKPLFEERPKRTRPDVFAIEDLQAIGGIAVLEPKDAAAKQDRAQRPGGFLAPPDATGTAPETAEPADPADNVPPATIVPYVIVTGLIPHAKQVDEYRQRFETASGRGPVKDAPRWSLFKVERTDVTNGPTNDWKRIDKDAFASLKKLSSDAKTALQPEVVLSSEELAEMGDTTYTMAMPTLAEGQEPWGPEAFSPRTLAGGKHRVFRFVDTTVEPGHRYRYRVTLSVLNPNHGVLPQHLDEPGLAKEGKLVSPASNMTKPVMIPQMTNFLARLRPKDKERELKGGAEVLTMRPNKKTGNYALHATVAGPGEIITIPRSSGGAGKDWKDVRPAKGKEPKGETISVGVLIDFLGKQTQPMQSANEPAEKKRGGKRTPPPEPFECLVIDEQGAPVRATVVDSEERVSLYEATLPEILRDDDAGAPK